MRTIIIDLLMYKKDRLSRPVQKKKEKQSRETWLHFD